MISLKNNHVLQFSSLLEGSEKMSNKENSAKKMNNIIVKIRCPLCSSDMNVQALSSLICRNNHTFDIAKQGYVNLLNRLAPTNYDKQLFHARQKIMTTSNLYTELHKKIAEKITKKIVARDSPSIMLDAGCGEGSHLQKIIEQTENNTIQGIGLDISKEGILLAAKTYKQPIWFVGDLANIPLNNQSCHFILNILSPANYVEFKRILRTDGLIIKVIPGKSYLKELREVVFVNETKANYKNEQITSLFKQHFEMVDELYITDSVTLSGEQLKYLVEMTPLTWNVTKEKLQPFLQKTSSEITVDFTVLVGKINS